MELLSYHKLEGACECMKEAYIVVTMAVTVAVSYEGDMPTKDECRVAMREYETENGVSLLEAVDILEVELDPESDVVE